MANQIKIAQILARSVRPGKSVKERDLTEISRQVVLLPRIDERTLRYLSEAVVKDADLFHVAAIDMGDINSELIKDPPPKK